MSLNNLSQEVSLASFVKEHNVTTLVLTPVANMRPKTSCSTWFEPCEISQAEMWAVMGEDEDGERHLIEDIHLTDKVGPVLSWMQDCVNLPISFMRLNGTNSGPMTLIDLAEWLTTTIHDEIPEIQMPDGRDDDFENHELAALREDICQASGYYGPEKPNISKTDMTPSSGLLRTIWDLSTAHVSRQTAKWLEDNASMSGMHGFMVYVPTEMVGDCPSDLAYLISIAQGHADYILLDGDAVVDERLPTWEW